MAPKLATSIMHHFQGRLHLERGRTAAACTDTLPAVSEIDEIATRRLRDDGQRFTTGRRLILKALAEADGPITIPTLLQHQPRLAQSSVYRNLVVLEHSGLVSKISMGDDHAHYELAEDLTQHHHHHLVCVGCGRVGDITLSEAAEASLDEALHAAANDADFELQHHRLDLVGRCAVCVAAGNRSIDTAAEAI
jgi:Fe2+ or Zn2+ uptake regulation protein